MSKYLVTAALPYANGPVHIGHLAGCYIPADIYVRYLRLKGEDVKFICGSDEHGVPITLKAKQLGISPQQVVDKYHGMMKRSFSEFGISFDHYSRTSAKIHHETAQDFFKTLYDKNVFEEIVSEQFYDEEAKQFLADRYIVGTCPKCGNENAYGDQCENCGTSLQPTDLINPKSKLSGSKPVLKATKNWYLPMGKIQQSSEFKEYIKRFENWKPNIKGQCESWLKEGLQPRAMTRDLDWGIPVPLPVAEGKVLYVWFDAPIGYISSTRELLPGDWEKYWKKQPNENDNAQLIHFIGKDNIVFHAIIFPMMLLQHGEFVLPSNVPANEFLNLEGDKISTSRNWAVWLHEYLKDFPEREDELRYVLTSIAPETKDSEFTWKDYQARVNNELADILGNYVKRVIDLVHRYCEGKVPPHHLEKAIEEKELTVKLSLGEIFVELGDLINNFMFRESLQLVINCARTGNQYLQVKEPWKLIKTDKDAVEQILRTSLVNCLTLAIICKPFLPKTSEKIFKQLNVDSNDPQIKWYDQPGNTGMNLILETGHPLNSSEILFKKIEDSEIENQIQKLHATKNMNEEIKSAIENPQSAIAIKPETSFDDFSKMDIRIATILEAERVPKTDKLLKLLLDTGIDKRTVVSGIAEYYEPEKIIGQQVVLLANLAPRKIKGIESKGMILMAENEKGELVFVSPVKNFDTGSRVK